MHWKWSLETKFDKDHFEVLNVSFHSKEYRHPEYIHTAICETNRPVNNFGLLAHIVSSEVGYDTNGYMYCGLNSIIFLGETKYKISWNTWHNCD